MKKEKVIKYLEKRLQKHFPEMEFERSFSFRSKDKSDTDSIKVDFFNLKNMLGISISSKHQKETFDLDNIKILVIDKHDYKSSYAVAKKQIEAKLALEESKETLSPERHPSDDLIVNEEVVVGGFKTKEIDAKDLTIELENEDLESYGSTEVNDLISVPPGWLLKSGITTIAIVTSVLLIFSAFFKYPDKIVANGIITSSTPESPLVSQAFGRIEKLYKRSHNQVLEGEIIAYINNNARLVDVEIYKQFLDKLEGTSSILSATNLNIPTDLILGDMQSAYGNLVLKLKELQITNSQRGVALQSNTIGEEISKIKLQNQSYSREQNLYDEEVKLLKKQLDRNMSLHKEGVISDQELEEVESRYQQGLRTKEGMGNNIVQNNIRIASLKLESQKLNEQRGNKLDEISFSLTESLASNKSALQNWENKYYIVANQSGKLEMPSKMDVNKVLNVGDIFGYIIPDGLPTSKFVMAKAAPAGIGKVEIGDKALIKVDAYPYKEFGLITSKVDEISQLTMSTDQQGNSFYEITIPLDEIIKTDYDKVLEYTPNMNVTVEIITEDKSILSRIMEQFVDLIKNI